MHPFFFRTQAGTYEKARAANISDLQVNLTDTTDAIHV